MQCEFPGRDSVKAYALFNLEGAFFQNQTVPEINVVKIRQRCKLCDRPHLCS